jgi:hypothetical protein
MWKLLVLAMIVLPSAGYAHDYCAKARCEETKQKIEKIQSKMRQGYSRAQGEKMEAELRKLRAIRSKRCR